MKVTLSMAFERGLSWLARGPSGRVVASRLRVMEGRVPTRRSVSAGRVTSPLRFRSAAAVLLFFSAVVPSALGQQPPAHPESPTAGVGHRKQTRGVAVIEYFTSWTAPRRVEMERDLSMFLTRYAGERIFFLPLHVDYGDTPTNKDPYGSATFSNRQLMYGKQFRRRMARIPYMVVNGSEDNFTVNHNTVGAQIDRALAKPPKVKLEAIAKRQERPTRAVLVKYRLTGIPAARKISTNINFALVDEVQPNPGDPEDESMPVVRILETRRTDQDEEGTVELLLRDDTELHAPSVVVFAQYDRDNSVVAATSVPIER